MSGICSPVHACTGWGLVGNPNNSRFDKAVVLFRHSGMCVAALCGLAGSFCLSLWDRREGSSSQPGPQTVQVKSRSRSLIISPASPPPPLLPFSLSSFPLL